MTEITNRDIEATKVLGEKLVEKLDRFKETKYPFHSYFEYINSNNRPEDDTCSKELYTKFIDVISIGDPIPVAEVIININEAKKMRKTRNIEEMEQKCFDCFFAWREDFTNLLYDFLETHAFLSRIDGNVSFELTLENIFLYLVDLDFPTLKEFITFLIDPSKILGLGYFESEKISADVIAFHKSPCGRYICDVKYIDRMLWERTVYDDVYDENENNQPMEDVKVTIPFRMYKKIIEKVKVTKTSKKQQNIPIECCICLEKFKSGRTIHKTPCGHFYHAMCLRTQLITVGPPKCPLCRFDVREAAI